MATTLHWFRRDFRVADNVGLYSASHEADSLAGIFVINPGWFPAASGQTGVFQAKFWLEALRELSPALAKLNVPLLIKTHADPVAAVLAAAKEIGATTITYNKEYEPRQIEQDDRLHRAAAGAGVKVKAYKDSCYFEEQEILTGGGRVYSVYSPYKRAYLRRLAETPVTLLGPPRTMPTALKVKADAVPSLKSLGYADVAIDIPTGESGAREMLNDFMDHRVATYRDARDYPLPPAGRGTSRFSAHLGAGTLSIRQAIHATVETSRNLSKAKPKGESGDGSPLHSPAESADHFLSELIWREFYRMILFNFPHTVRKPFQENYEHVTWTGDAEKLAAWTEGRTGYPFVDAGIWQMRTTGFMHNRLRMVTAMFLTKDLDVHWIEGERVFMQHLMDYDQACNVGGWQWSASTGTDAAPYFRVMNPLLQSARYDPQGAFIKKMLPQLQHVPTEFIHAPWQMPPEVQKASGCVIGKDYPAPIVDHHEAKEHAIAKFKQRA